MKRMRSPIKLLLIFGVTAAAGAGFTAWEATRYARQEFSRIRGSESAALVAQFQREFAQQGEHVIYALQGIADAESTLRMALDLSRPESDPSVYENDARGLAQGRQLDYLELAADDGTVISSTQGPDRVGQKDDWVAHEADWNRAPAFLERVDSPSGADLYLMAVRGVHVGEKNLYLIGGLRFDQGILGALAVPQQMRTLLYRNLDSAFAAGDLTGAEETIEQPERFAPLIESALSQPGQSTEQTIPSASDANTSETFTVLPLLGRQKQVLAVFLAGAAQSELPAFAARVRNAALLSAGGAMLVALLVSLWVSARLTRPLERLTAATRDVAGGNWEARIKSEGRGETGRLARSFNEMTHRLALEKERLAQAERVAAWRELARRLAFELKGPLFGLQITIESLARSHGQKRENFDEVFTSAMATLRAEFASLNGSIGRFNEFANMPPLRPRQLSVNELVRYATKNLEPRFSAVGRPPIVPELHLDENLPEIQGDPELLRQALENLLANSCEAMLKGGTLTLRTSHADRFVRIELSDAAGSEISETDEAPAQSFAAKLNGTGLGLAVAQSVVSDHGGRITIETATGTGTTYRVELPLELPPSALVAHPGVAPAWQKPFVAPAPVPAAEASEPAEKPVLEPTLPNI